MATISTPLTFREPLHELKRTDRTISRMLVRGDLTSAETVVAEATRLRIACRDVRRLIVDAGSVVEVDTKFVAVLVDLYRTARIRGVELVILPSHALRRWIRVCRLEGLLR